MNENQNRPRTSSALPGNRRVQTVGATENGAYVALRFLVQGEVLLDLDPKPFVDLSGTRYNVSAMKFAAKFEPREGHIQDVAAYMHEGVKDDWERFFLDRGLEEPK